jgi:elongation factor P
MVSTNNLKKGIILKIGGELYAVLFHEHHKPGKGGAIVRTKLRNIQRDTVIDKTFRAGEMLEDVFVDSKEAQLLYREDSKYIFMDNESFEQYSVPEELVGEASKYLKNEMVCTLSVYEGEIIAVQPPMFVDLVITETDPGLRGDTVSGGSKPATLETGAVIQVPLFVGVGEKIRVDTRDDRYVERVK